MSIYGIGTDVVMVSRMAALYERHGARVLDKLLAPEERERCRQMTAPERFLAKRFAAKEALGKALGTGIRKPVLLPSIAVLNNGDGKPEFRFKDDLAEYMRERGLKTHLSISDEQDVAIAFVVLEAA